MGDRVRVKITARDADTEHVLTMDTARGSWSLEELQELARTVAEAAGFVHEGTRSVSVVVDHE